MIVEGDTVKMNSHYGSVSAMTDYKSQAHSVYFNASFAPSAAVRLYGTLNLNKTKGELDPVEMPSVEARLDGGLSHQDFTFDHMHLYSDLDYQWLRIGVGVDFALSARTTLELGADFADLDDKSGGYVYGDESGSHILVRSGLRFDL